jgi:hypothetical protein
VIGSKQFRARHLDDERLYECYVAGQTGDALDPVAADHLADCVSCQGRYAELASFAGALRTEADAEIDALFPADALLAQQTQIARRIEHLGHAARVISFPHHQASAAGGKHTWGVAPRWLAVAAAAGLVIGVGVGSIGLGRISQSLSIPHGHTIFSSAPARPAAVVPVSMPATSAPPAASDPKDADRSDEFLQELEFALERPRTRELRALDELTPHVREVSLNASVR